MKRPPDAPRLQPPPRRILPPSRVDTAMAAHRRKFGFEPDVFWFWNLRRWDQLAVAIEAAVASNRPFDPEAVARAWGLRNGPPGAEG
jgi:hypothetical protein